MQQRICFSKRVGIISLLGVIVFITALALNTLTKQTTSTNSRASKPSLQAEEDPPIISPIICNSSGDIVVKDSETEDLWSWASKPITSNGIAACASEKYTPEKSNPKVPLIYPSDSASNKYVQFYKKLGKNTPLCYKHGIRISINQYTSIATNQNEVDSVPSYLVGTRVANSLCSDRNSHECVKGKYMLINDYCWHLGYLKENKNNINMCSSNIVTSTKDTCGEMKKI